MISPRFRSLVLGLFYVALASLPLSVNWFSDRWRFGVMMASEPLMALMVGLLVLGLLAGWVARPRTLHLLDKLLGLHFGALALATAFSSDLRVSVKYFVTLVLFASFGYGVPRVLRLARTEWLRAVAALALGTAVLAAYVLVRHAQVGISYSVSYFIAQPFLAHGHTNLTVLLEPLVLVLNLMLLYYPWAQSQRSRLWITVLLTVVLMVVAFSYSRASYLSLLAQALLLLAFSGWKAGTRLLLPWAVAGCLVLVGWQAAALLHPDPLTQAQVSAQAEAKEQAEAEAQATVPNNPNLLHELGSVSDFSSTNESNAERKNRWVVCLKLYRQHPVLGIGPGTFPDRYLDFVRSSPDYGRYFTTFRRMNAHNLYLSWLAESGTLGFLSGLLLLGYLVVGQLRWVLRARQSPVQVGFTVYFLFFVMHSFVQDFWQEPRVIVVFWFVAGLQQYYLRARTPVPESVLSV